MNVWEWPQITMAVVIGIVMIGTMLPPRKDSDFFALPIWVVITWVLWMGGFWS